MTRGLPTDRGGGEHIDLLVAETMPHCIIPANVMAYCDTKVLGSMEFTSSGILIYLFSLYFSLVLLP